MVPSIFYEPFYFEIERLLNDSSLSKQDRKATRCNVAPVVRSFNPRLDLHEDAEKNVVTATFEFPGFSKDSDDVQINVQNRKLTVSATSETLPQGVQDEQIKATMENGLLTVTFPKTLLELAPKKIMIQASD